MAKKKKGKITRAYELYLNVVNRNILSYRISECVRKVYNRVTCGLLHAANKFRPVIVRPYNFACFIAINFQSPRDIIITIVMYTLVKIVFPGRRGQIDNSHRLRSAIFLRRRRVL